MSVFRWDYALLSVLLLLRVSGVAAHNGLLLSLT